METATNMPPNSGPESTPPNYPSYSYSRSQATQDSRRKSPILAGLLSLLPGLGQVYVGYYQQGFINLLVIGCTISLLATGLGPLTPLGGFFVAFYWMFNIIDASRRALFYNETLAGLEQVELPAELKLPSGQGTLLGGILLVCLGGIALSHTVFGYRLDWLEDWWPAALIIVGLVLIGQSAYQKYYK